MVYGLMPRLFTRSGRLRPCRRTLAYVPLFGLDRQISSPE